MLSFGDAAWPKLKVNKYSIFVYVNFTQTLSLNCYFLIRNAHTINAQLIDVIQASL